MNLEVIILLIIISSTVLILILHTLLKNKNSFLANIINRLWDEWFEEQYNDIVVFIMLIVIRFIIALIFE